MDPVAGPIIKDALYFGFWSRAVAALVVVHLLEIVLLYLILRKP